MLNGIFILAELHGEAAKQIADINARFDRKLAAAKPPHVTMAGSSGVGPLPASTTAAELEELLRPVTDTTAPLELEFGAPMRFMQSDIVVISLSPHGKLRELHDRIATCGLPFARARFSFTPHVTLSLYPRLDQRTARELLAVRIGGTCVIDSLQCYHTRDPQPARKLLELPLSGAV
ncbi:MAG TPA: 2'-5' RNA ligase family protein [Gemmatimonadaceae bacterium]|nr:2'-5' RNA ligase family protein [Gemmatimonadaceae bacterium]